MHSEGGLCQIQGWDKLAVLLRAGLLAAAVVDQQAARGAAGGGRRRPCSRQGRCCGSCGSRWRAAQRCRYIVA